MNAEIEVLLALIKSNEDASARRHEDLRGDMRELSGKVDSLIESRTLAKGAWKATTAIAAGVASLVSGLGAILVWFFRSAH